MEDNIYNLPPGMDDQEEDVCRVCRLEEEPDNPMVHPCKCSGSVRYVHPDCLKNWLAASQKKTCEICGYRYSFTKVYPDHIPETIPVQVYLRQMIKQVLKVARYISRCWLVVIVWLIVLPLANMGGLRTFAWFTDYATAGLATTGSTGAGINTTPSTNATLLDAMQNNTSNTTTVQPFPNHSPTALIMSLLGGLFRLLFPQYQRWTSPSSNVTNTSALPSPVPDTKAHSYIFATTFDVPSPYYVFQGQILSVALGAMIIALIFLREWYASYNWAQHDKPKPHVEENIIPEEWVVKRGVTERRYTRLSSGKLVSVRAERRKKALIAEMRNVYPEDTESGVDTKEDQERGEGSLASGAPGAPSLAYQQSAAAGPGPSTLAFRASAPSPDVVNRIRAPTREQEAESIKHLQTVLLRARDLRDSRPTVGSPEKRVADVAWKAPELLAETEREGAGASPGNEEEERGEPIELDEEVHPSEVKDLEGVEIEDPEVEESPATSSNDPTLKANSPILPAAPAFTTPIEDTAPHPSDIGPTLGMLIGMTAHSPTNKPDDPIAGLITTILGLQSQQPSETDIQTLTGVLALGRMTTQFGVDMQQIQDRNYALDQDAQQVYARGLENEDLPPGYIMGELALVDTRRNDITADMARLRQRAQAMSMLKMGYNTYMPEIREIHVIDRANNAEVGARGEDVWEMTETDVGTGSQIAQASVESQASEPEDSPLSEEELGTDVGVISEPSVTLSDNMIPQAGSSGDNVPLSPSHMEHSSTSHAEMVTDGQDNTAGLDQTAEGALGDDPEADSLPEPSTNAEAQASSSTHTNIAVNGEADLPSATIAIQKAIENAEANNADMARMVANEEDPRMRRQLVKILETEKEAGEKEVERVRRREAGLDNGEEIDETSEDGFEEEMIGAADLEVPARVDVLPRQDGPEAIVQNLREEAEDDDDDDDIELNEEDLAQERADNAAALAEEGIDLDEDVEGAWAAEDMDQMLEVVGLIGPVGALLQNLVLAIAVMGAAMTCFVLTPMSFGKIVLSIDPIRSILKGGTITWDLSRAFLRWSRFITDPVIDMGVEIGRDVVLRPAFGALIAYEQIVARELGLESREMPSTRYIRAYHRLISLLQQAYILADYATPPKQKLWTPNIYTIVIPKIIANRSRFIPSTIPILLNPNPIELVNAIENLGHKSFKAYEAYRTLAVRLATGHTLADGIACLVVGYAVVLGWMTILAWQAERGTFKVLGKEWKQGLRRYRLSAKLVMFLALELVAFPLGAGALIALCTIPVFPHQSRWGKIGDMHDTIFGMLFITWLIGTMFMYGFAQVLSWCRSFCRPGALYFIRDPHDPNYSPVKEIINRSTGAQFRKLGISTLMYSFLIWWLFGAVPWTITLLGSKMVLPLRLDGFGPLTPIPFDYLFLLVAVPPTIHRLRPQHTVKKILLIYWRTFERLLRLDPLLNLDKTKHRSVLVHRPAGPKETLFWRIVDIPFQAVFGKYDPAATFARVPAHDRVILLAVKKNGTPKRVGMFVRLDRNGQPKTSDDKVKMIRQDLLARRAERDPTTDFRITHLPHYWRTRIHGFILVLLAGAGAALATFILGPVILGREILKVHVGKVHDGYSFLVGAYTIYAAMMAGLRAYKIIISFGRATQKRGSGRQARVKRFIVNNLRRAISLLAVYLVHPILKGLVWELRIGTLVRYGFGPGTPVIHLWDAWALGAVLNSIELGACGLFGRGAGNPTYHDVHNLWRHPLQYDLLELGKTLLPEYGSLLIDLALPFVLTFIVLFVGGRNANLLKMQFRVSGLVSWAMRAIFVRVRTIKPRLAAYRQRVIDAEYVVEERVQNYEPEPEVPSGPPLFAAGVPGSEAVDGPNEAAPFEDEDLEAMGLGDYEMMEDGTNGEIHVGGGYNGLDSPPLRREVIYEEEDKFPGEGNLLGGAKKSGEEKDESTSLSGVQVEQREATGEGDDDGQSIDA